jgi:periplasmic protein TonB
MTSLTVERPFECTPHAIRSVAMALALSLNLAVMLLVIRPTATLVLRPPAPRSLLATILLPPPPPVPPPAVPSVRVVKHVAVAVVHVPLVSAIPIAVQPLPGIAPVATQVPVVADAGLSSQGTAPANSEATIAYETATPPAYPIQAMRAGVQGTVMLKVLVDPNGKPVEVLVAQSSGSHLLDAAARRHVFAAWRFHPAMRDGHAIEAWAMVPIRFDLGRG